LLFLACSSLLFGNDDDGRQMIPVFLEDFPHLSANGKENLTHYGDHKLTHLFLKNLVVKKSKKRYSKPVLNSLEF